MAESVLTAFTTAATTVKTDVFSMIEVALPAGLAIMGAIMAVRIGVKFFKSISK